MSRDKLDVLETTAVDICRSAPLGDARGTTGVAAAAFVSCVPVRSFHGPSERCGSHLSTPARRNRYPLLLRVRIHEIYEGVSDPRAYWDRPLPTSFRHMRRYPDPRGDLAAGAQHGADAKLCDFTDS